MGYHTDREIQTMASTWVDGMCLKVFLTIYEEYRRIGNANAPLFKAIDQRVIEFREDEEFFDVFFYDKQDLKRPPVQIRVRKRDYQVRDVM